jgi:hypothetical protein
VDTRIAGQARNDKQENERGQDNKRSYPKIPKSIKSWIGQLRKPQILFNSLTSFHIDRACCFGIKNRKCHASQTKPQNALKFKKPHFSLILNNVLNNNNVTAYLCTIN